MAARLLRRTLPGWLVPHGPVDVRQVGFFGLDGFCAPVSLIDIEAYYTGLCEQNTRL